MEDIAARHPEAFVRVTAAWVSDVLERRDAQRVRDYSKAHETLRDMRAGRPATQPRPLPFFFAVFVFMQKCTCV